MSLGIMWASRITTVGLAFVLPVLGGVGLDRWLGTTPWGAVVGVVLGFVVSLLRIIRIAQTGQPD